MRKENVLSLSFSFLMIVLVAMVVQSFLPRPPLAPAREVPKAEKACVGTPIYVNAEYNGSTVNEWSCQPQCDDKIQRYLVYTNGVATPCDTLPGCFDYGEDNGVTCIPPAGSAQSQAASSAKN